jgi:hypothetical protein
MVMVSPQMEPAIKQTHGKAPEHGGSPQQWMQ